MATKVVRGSSKSQGKKTNSESQYLIRGKNTLSGGVILGIIAIIAFVFLIGQDRFYEHKESSAHYENNFLTINKNIKSGQKTYFHFVEEVGNRKVTFESSCHFKIITQEGKDFESRTGSVSSNMEKYHTGVYVIPEDDTEFKIILH